MLAQAANDSSAKVKNPEFPTRQAAIKPVMRSMSGAKLRLLAGPRPRVAPASPYLHTTVDESWTAVISPLAFTVMWKTSVSRKFGVSPCPMILKLLT